MLACHNHDPMKPAQLPTISQARARHLVCQAVPEPHVPEAHGISCHRRSLLLAGASSVLLPGAMHSAPALASSLATSMAVAPLAQGLTISRVVKGCWQLSGGHRGDAATDRTQGKAVLEDFTTFYQNGITTFDTADHYGPSELLIGRWLQQQSQAAGQSIRDRVQVMTKVCVFDGMSMATVNPGSMAKAVDTSVKRLGTTPDVIQFYWGAYDIPRYVDAARYLADEQAKAQFTHLGVTNFDVKRVEEITNAGVKLVSNQLQYSLLDRRPDNGMIAFCQQNGIKLLPYGVLAGGLLSAKYLSMPVDKVNLDTWSKRKYAAVLESVGSWAWFQRLLGVLDGIAQKHQSTISNVAARWVLDRPGVAGVILGARNALHVADDVALSSLQLDADDQAAIQEVLAAGKQPQGDCYQWERGLGPF